MAETLNVSGTWACPKCGHTSGDSWAQCCGKCPIEQSPYYDKETAEKYGNPVPYLTPSGVQDEDPVPR